MDEVARHVADEVAPLVSDTQKSSDAVSESIQHAVPIPLPEEPPRDRVIEAVKGRDRVVRWWVHDGAFWVEHWHGPETLPSRTFGEVVRTASRYDWALRHVPKGDDYA